MSHQADLTWVFFVKVHLYDRNVREVHLNDDEAVPVDEPLDIRHLTACFGPLIVHNEKTDSPLYNQDENLFVHSFSLECHLFSYLRPVCRQMSHL